MAKRSKSDGEGTARPRRSEAEKKKIYEAIAGGHSYAEVGKKLGISSASVRIAALTYAARNGLVLESQGRISRGEDVKNVGVGLTSEERAKITKAAEKAGKAVSAFMREAALEAA